MDFRSLSFIDPEGDENKGFDKKVKILILLTNRYILTYCLKTLIQSLFFLSVIQNCTFQ